MGYTNKEYKKEVVYMYQTASAISRGVWRNRLKDMTHDV